MAEFVGAAPVLVRAALTWNPTVVVEAVFDADLTVFVKAGATQNAHTEAAVMDLVRRAGVPVCRLSTYSALASIASSQADDG